MWESKAAATVPGLRGVVLFYASNTDSASANAARGTAATSSHRAAQPKSSPRSGPLRTGPLNREIFFTLMEAKILIEQWRREYNTIRPHSSLGYRPPAPETTRPDRAFLDLPALRGPLPLKGALN